MTLLLTDIHEVAYQILEQTEHLPHIPKPTNGNTAWHMAYAGHKAHMYAYRALHQRDKAKAHIYLTQAIENIKLHKGETV